jgi:hypothetical protein
MRERDVRTAGGWCRRSRIAAGSRLGPGCTEKRLRAEAGPPVGHRGLIRLVAFPPRRGPPDTPSVAPYAARPADREYAPHFPAFSAGPLVGVWSRSEEGDMRDSGTGWTSLAMVMVLRMATTLLVDLRDIADRAGRREVFARPLDSVGARHAAKPALPHQLGAVEI